MGRSPCCTKEGLNRGAWTAIEDKILIDYIKLNGEGKWRNLPKRAGLKRCGKSCRLRWMNYLRPDIKRGNITTDEEDLIVRLHNLLGNRWSLIAGRLPGRTDNEIKNYWNTRSKKTQVNKTPNSIATSPNMKSGVIRTKASKCTQVIVSPDPMLEMPKYQAPADGGPTDLAEMASTYFDLEESRIEFSLDFQMDDKFLSDFLKDEFPPLDVNEIGGFSSSDYEQTRMFTDEILGLDSMVPFTDWPRDE